MLTASHTKFLPLPDPTLRASMAAARNELTVLTLASQKEAMSYGKLCFLHNSFTKGETLLRWQRGSLGNKWCSIWNCKPPWNQSMCGEHEMFSEPIVCFSNQSLPVKEKWYTISQNFTTGTSNWYQSLPVKQKWYIFSQNFTTGTSYWYHTLYYSDPQLLYQ